MVLDLKEELLVLIDGTNWLTEPFRLTAPAHQAGVFTNAVYGFLTMLFKVLKDYNPAYVVVAFDKSRITLRAEEFAEYKATASRPPELREQFAILKEILTPGYYLHGN